MILIPILNQTLEFKDEDAQRTLVREHIRELQNSCVLFTKWIQCKINTTCSRVSQSKINRSSY